jgi:hypothetical protein
MTTLGKLLDKQFPGGSEKLKTVPLPMNPTEALRRARLGEDAANIPWIQPGNVPVVNELVRTRRENGFNRNDPKDRAEFSKRLKASAERDADREEMAAYRTFELTNDVMATPFALGAFQTVDLSPDELPLIERPRSRNYQRFTVRSQSIDGGAREAQWRTTKEVSQYELDAIATDRVEYPIMDIQQGDINQSDAINTELRYDMEMKVDGLARTNLDAAQTASGLRALLSIHPNVVQANIPDANYFDLNALFAGSNDVLTMIKLKYILNHIALLQSVGGPGEGLTIQTIMLSPQNMRDSWDFVDLVSGVGSATEGPAPANTVTTAQRESIFSTGMMTSAWGYTWNWTPNSQIAKGRMYIFMNQPLGWQFTKTSFDKTLVWNETNSPDHAESNMGEVMYRRVMSFLVPDLWKYRVLIIDL